MKNSLAPGLYRNLSIAEYHADAALGSSSLKILATKTPLHLKEQVRTESVAFDFGSALHTAILEPEESDKIICGPEDRRGNKWKEAKEEADAKGALLLTASDYESVMRAAQSVFKNEDCKHLLSGKIETELSIFHNHEETGLRCKIRPDLFNHDLNVMVDLKTCLSASPYAFSKSIFDYGYHIQAAFYQTIWQASQNKLDAFYFIAIEKTEPYAVAVYELDQVSICEGLNLVDIGMRLYGSCKETNSWPGYPKGINKISLPSYAFKTFDLNSLTEGMGQVIRL